MGLHDVDYDNDDHYNEDDDIDLDITELDEDEIFIHPTIESTKSEYICSNTDKAYIAFLKKYFSSFCARKMVSSFTKVTQSNQVFSTNTSGSLLDEVSSGNLAVALYTFKKHQEYLDRLFSELLLESTRSMYLYKVIVYLSLFNKYKESLKIKRLSNTTIAGIGNDEDIANIDKKNYIAVLVTSQFIMRNVENVYTHVSHLQNREGGSDKYVCIDLDITQCKCIKPYIWYTFDLGIYGDTFKDCKQDMTLVWLDGMDIPSIYEFLNKQKHQYRLQLVTRVFNNKYIRYGIEYEDDEVLCTIARPNMVLYPNVCLNKKGDISI